MKLKALLAECNYEIVKGNINSNIEYITESEEEIRENSLFIVYRENEGIDEIKRALNKGATAIISEHKYDIKGDFTFIKVDDARISMANISKKYFNNPTFNFRLTAITGSSEKTAVIELTSKILKNLNKKIASIGTEENYLDSEVLESKNIAQNTIKLQHLFHEMAVANVSDVIMEVSSRTIAGDRVYGINFDIAVFTNLEYEESKDFYKNEEEYKNNKREVFEKSAKAAVNMDDDAYIHMIKELEFRTLITYSTKNKEAVLFASNIEEKENGRNFVLKYLGENINVNMNCKKYDMHTILASISACLLANNSMDKIVKGLSA